MLPEIEQQSLHARFSYPPVSLDYVDRTDDAGFQQNLSLRAHFPADAFAYRVVKRALDITAVLAISPLVVLVCSSIALVSLSTSKGPVFFRHRRVRGEGYFDMWKFRTMCDNADQVLREHFELYPEARKEWDACHKLRDDPRTNAFGAFLRRTSLDELPQIWNVLRGDMSLVGPRPIVVQEIAKYGSDFCYYASVKPGITGLWQTSGRSTLSYSARVALDRFYVENWSLGLELKILARTPRSVANTDSAY